jgi:hypothetical protein
MNWKEYIKWQYFLTAGGIVIVSFLIAFAKDIKTNKAMTEQLADIQIEQEAAKKNSGNNWILEYLLANGMDTAKAQRYSVMPRGPLFDTEGEPIMVTWVDIIGDIGILKMPSVDSTGWTPKTLDTLWIFEEAK